MIIAAMNTLMERLTFFSWAAATGVFHAGL